MKYYISINSWNLLESFVTESLSPFAFYDNRNFGNNLSRHKSNNNEKINFLVLSLTDNGGEYAIEIEDSILDRNSIKPIKNLKTLFTYSKTVYYKKGQVAFRFSHKSLVDAFMAESQILFEVKCIEKYKESFFVKEIKEKKASVTLQRIGESFSFEQQDFIDKDNKFNLLKGAIVGYVRGELTAFGLDDQRLISMIKDLKNSFTGLNTQIMVNSIEVPNPEVYMIKLRECKKMFCDIRKEKTNSFDILTQLFMEIRKFSSLRYSELAAFKSTNWNITYEKLLSRKQDLEIQINQVELKNNIASIREELNQIKEQERLIGKFQGKTRVYFKKDTPEYARKCQLKELLKEFENNNGYYKSLCSELDEISRKLIDSTSGRTQYDNALSALFTRVSDIVNDLLKKIDAGKTLNRVGLSPLKYVENGSIQLEDTTVDSAEMEFFNILLSILTKRDTLEPISEAFILTLIEETANQYKVCLSSTTEKGKKLIACLRDYWKYKHNKNQGFVIPEDMPILQSIMAFFLKPFGFDQIERYMLNKKYTEKKYAMMLWGAYNGYAALPKTFTSILYEDESYYKDMDDLLQIIYNSL